MSAIRVQFVCLGNICRSPLAEGVFRHLVAEAGLAAHFQIASAGTGGWHAGEAPDPRSTAVARKNGVDISAQRARALRPQDLDYFDEIRVMDRSNLRDVEARMKGTHRARVGLFLDDAQAERAEVPDPYYGGPQGFDDVYALVLDGCAGLLARLRAAHGL